MVDKHSIFSQVFGNYPSQAIAMIIYLQAALSSHERQLSVQLPFYFMGSTLCGDIHARNFKVVLGENVHDLEDVIVLQSGLFIHGELFSVPDIDTSIVTQPGDIVLSVVLQNGLKNIRKNGPKLNGWRRFYKEFRTFSGTCNMIGDDKFCGVNVRILVPFILQFVVDDFRCAQMGHNESHCPHTFRTRSGAIHAIVNKTGTSCKRVIEFIDYWLDNNTTIIESIEKELLNAPKGETYFR